MSPYMRRLFIGGCNLRNCQLGSASKDVYLPHIVTSKNASKTPRQMLDLPRFLRSSAILVTFVSSAVANPVVPYRRAGTVQVILLPSSLDLTIKHN